MLRENESLIRILYLVNKIGVEKKSYVDFLYFLFTLEDSRVLLDHTLLDKIESLFITLFSKLIF